MMTSGGWVSMGHCTYGGQKYESKAKTENGYLAKVIPTFPQMETGEVDFGFGRKKVDRVLEHDVKRMYHSFQGQEVPKKLTEDEEGVNAVYRAIYWMTDDDDELFYKVSQAYNQRIGLDLVHLAREQMGQRIEHLDSQNYHLNLSLEEVFPKKEKTEKELHLIATAHISGDILDPETGEILPVRFHVHGRYDLTIDQALHTITYRLENVK